ncbi:hydroxyethylthiazole kinase [Haloferacaceae archaeon DSL9]
MPEFTAASLADALDRVEAASPLVQQLTNEVTKNDLANVTLHWGGLPTMADAPEEAAEMAELADAILLNTGRMTKSNVEALHNAGRAANDLGVPVVLDPVGAGATPTRTDAAESLLSEIDFAAIKGNYGEVSTLAGVEAEVKGVESVGEYDDIGETTRALAASTGAVVVASGVEDVVSDGERTYRLPVGHEAMGTVVGTGCMLGGTIATFCGAVDDERSATIHGTVAYGVAGELAADRPYNGPASYKINFLDAVANLTAETAADVDLGRRVERTE